MIKRSINIDFSRKTGKIKPLTCLNNGPKFGMDLKYDFTEQYKEISPAFIRVSDIESPYLSSRYLDIHCIFPDMDLDERFEASYNFAPTDRYLASIKDMGADIFLRLGESTEPYEVKKYTRPPRDYAKIARICERIIAHYNKGWGNGFKYNIKYVEIMASPDTPSGWHGSREEYYEFYSVVSQYIKEQHPKIKVGAYSSGGFFSLNHYDATAEEKSYTDFLDCFLEYISKKNKSPLDFFTWKCYADSPEEVSLHANYARSYLGQYGFKKAQSIITEFNLRNPGSAPLFLDKTYPARLARSLIIAQKSSVDMMFYSHLSPDSEMNSLYSIDDRKDKRIYSSYHVMAAFGALSRLGNVVDSTEDYRREIYSLAATGDNEGACVFATADYSGVVEINMSGKSFTTYSIKGIVGGGERGSGFFFEETDLPLKDGPLTLRVGKEQVFFLTFK